MYLLLHRSGSGRVTCTGTDAGAGADIAADAGADADVGAGADASAIEPDYSSKAAEKREKNAVRPPKKR